MNQTTINDLTAQLLMDAFSEENHPRDEKGRFAPGEHLVETDKTVFKNDDYNSKEKLAGKQLREVKAPDFDKYVKADLHEPPMKLRQWQHPSAGVILIEPGNKTWIISPKNYFGGYRNTFPKGTPDKDEALQKAALREVWEETGMVAKITGYLGDVERSTSVGRYYIGERVSGSPAKAGEETHAVKLVGIDDKDLADRLRNVEGKKTADHNVLEMLKSYVANPESYKAPEFVQAPLMPKSSHHEHHVSAPTLGSGKQAWLPWWKGQPIGSKLSPALQKMQDELSGKKQKIVVVPPKIKACIACEGGDCVAHATPKCPHCGSDKYELMPTDFETAKCADCGKTWDHGIVKGINDPSDVEAGGPGSGRHPGLAMPKLKTGTRGVGKDAGAVFPVHGPGSEYPGRHISYGKYAKAGDNHWTADGPFKFDVFKDKVGTQYRVGRTTTYSKGGSKVTQMADSFQYKNEAAADAHLKKRFGIDTQPALFASALEERVYLFAMDVLQADGFDEGLHPRDAKGKFIETGGPQLTPMGKVGKLGGMGFSHKESHGVHAPGIGKTFMKDVYTHPKGYEVHVTKYNTTHPGNADLRKYALINSVTGKTIVQGHQISKIADAISKAAELAKSNVSAPAPVAKPAVTKQAESSKLTEGAQTLLQNNGFSFVSHAGKVDTWEHDISGTKFQWDQNNFSWHVTAPNGDKTSSGSGASFWDLKGGKNQFLPDVQQAITKAIGTPATAAPKSAPAPAVKPADLSGPATDKDTSKYEQDALKANGFTYTGPAKGGFPQGDLWDHPSGVHVVTNVAGFTVYDKAGVKTGTGLTAYDNPGEKDLHPHIESALTKAGATSEPKTGGTLTVENSEIGPKGKESLEEMGFKPESTDKHEEIWTHPESGHTLQYVVSPQGMEEVGQFKLSDKNGNELLFKDGGNGSGGVWPNKNAIKDAMKQSMTDQPSFTSVAVKEALTKAGFEYTGDAPGIEGDVWEHKASGVGVVLGDNSMGPQVWDIVTPEGDPMHEGAHPDPEILKNGELHPDIKEAIGQKSAEPAPAPVVPAPAAEKTVPVGSAKTPGGMLPNKTGSSAQTELTKIGFSFIGKGPYDADVWKHPSGAKVQVMGTKYNVITPTGQKIPVGGKLYSYGVKNYIAQKVQSTGGVTKTGGTAPVQAVPLTHGTSKVGMTTADKLSTAGFAPATKVGTLETWNHLSGAQLFVNTAGASYTWSLNKDGNIIESGHGLNSSLDKIIGAVKPADHPSKAAGPQIPAAGKNTALKDAGYEFQKNEGGKDYWSKPGGAGKAAVYLEPTDPTHTKYVIYDQKTGVKFSEGPNAGTMISELNQHNNPTPVSTPKPSSSYTPSSYTPKPPAPDWTQITDKAWQGKAQQVVADLWSKSSAADKMFNYGSPGGVYKKIADALGVPWQKLDEVKEKIGSWQGGTTAASGGNKIGEWAQQIVNKADSVHPGMYIEHLVSKERIKDQYGGVVPELYRGLHSPGDPEKAGTGPSKGNIAVLKGAAQMAGELGFKLPFPVYGAEGFSSAKSVSTSFGGSGVVITKAAGNISPDWVMSSRDLNPGMWTGYAGEHEWAIAFPKSVMPIDSEKGDKLSGSATESGANLKELFMLLDRLADSGWDYTADLKNKEIELVPPRTWTNENWFRWARHPKNQQKTIKASAKEGLRQIIVPGLPPIRIEYEMGQTRQGCDKWGNDWKQIMPYSYGYFVGTRGLDGEPVDCIIGLNPKAPRVYIACIPANLGNEEKVMVGFDSLIAAKMAFLACYGFQQKFLQTITEVPKALLSTIMKTANGAPLTKFAPRDTDLTDMAPKITAGGPGSGRHPGNVFYHGTTEEMAQKILKEGLKPFVNPTYKGQAPAVFVSKDQNDARGWAAVKGRPGSAGKRPVVLTLNLPDSIAKKLRKDKAYNEEGPRPGRYYNGTIPAEHITKMEVGSRNKSGWDSDPPEWKDTQLSAAGDWEEEKHPRGQGGKFASGGLKDAHPDKEQWPDHIKALKLPPGWTDVKYSHDPASPLQAIGKDSKGRAQYVYSKEFQDSQAAMKFERIAALDKEINTVDQQLEKGRNSADPKEKDHADCASLIRTMGIRPGSDDDTKAKVKAYGATTLTGNHVVQTPDGGMRLQFTGKKGVNLDLPVEDEGVRHMLATRKQQAGDTGKLFPTVTDGSLLDYVHSNLDHGGFKTKDFRTYLGTHTAASLVASMPEPKNRKEYVSAVKEVAKSVSQKLGNTPTVALQSYIAPQVFAGWKMRAGVTAGHAPRGLAEVHYGSPKPTQENFRKRGSSFDHDDSDTQKATDPSVVKMLGFDPAEIDWEAEDIKAEYFESTTGLNVLPTSYPPSLKNRKPVNEPLASDGWHKKDSKKAKTQARKDMAEIMKRTRRQIGKPELAQTAITNYSNPYPDTIL